MIAYELIDTLKPQQLRQAFRTAQAETVSKNEVIARQEREVAFKQATIDKLTHEMAVLKRLKFAAQSEKYAQAFTPEQKSLIEETLDTDLAALAAEIEVQQPANPEREDKQSPKRLPLPGHLPRREIRHEPEDTACGCGQAMKRIGQDVAEMLKQPVLHADETPVFMLKPAHLKDGKTHKSYLWSYCTTGFNPMRAVVFDFADSRGGQHVRDFLGLPGTECQPAWKGKLVTDDFNGYKACFELGVNEAGCMAHARRKFHELWANHASQIGEQELKFFGKLYEVEREVRDMPADERKAIRQVKSLPIADALHQWLTQQRQKVPDGSATARAIDYSLKRWKALVRFIDDGELPIDNNWVENQIRPIAIGRNNWLFAGSLRAGKRAAAVMSLVHSARLNGHDPYEYLRDVFQRLPTQPASRVGELLPHRWQPPGAPA